MESLKDKTVGIVRGYNYGETFVKSALFKREESDDILTNVKKLLADRINLTLDDKIVVSSLLMKTNPKMLEQIEFTKDSLVTNKLYVTSGLKNPRSTEIINAFNKGLAVIKANGKFTEIMKKYGIN